MKRVLLIKTSLWLLTPAFAKEFQLLCLLLLGSALLGATFFTPHAIGEERRAIPQFRSFGEPAHKTDAQAIDSLMQQFRAAWSRQDSKAILATHSDDIEWINAYARIFRGKDALNKFLDKRLFPAFDPAVSKQEARNMQPISRRYIGSKAALLHWYTEGSRGNSRNQGEKLRRTHLHFVLAKHNGGWKISHIAIFDAR